MKGWITVVVLLFAIAALPVHAKDGQQDKNNASRADGHDDLLPRKFLRRRYADQKVMSTQSPQRKAFETSCSAGMQKGDRKKKGARRRPFR